MVDTHAQGSFSSLSERERAILRLMAEGLSNQEIANRLFLALTTVKWYIRQINEKLDTHSRTQTVARAHQLKLVGEGDTTRVAQVEAHEPPDNPYKGLHAFGEADAEDFFGRESFIRRLVERLGEKDRLSRFLAVVGPSGSGKSSVVKAGLIPALRGGDLPGSETWLVTEMLPGTHPLEELELALLRIAINQPPSLLPQLREDERGLLRAARRVLPNDNGVLVLVIDQFEEVFTLVENELERRHFLNSINVAATDARSLLRIIITLRADFYDCPLLYTEFGDLTCQRTEAVLPLTAEEIEQVITRPAARVGVTVESGLVAAMVAEVNQQPGGLPLLQYALTELFDACQGSALTLDAYRAIGGVTGALARRADGLYAGLDAGAQETARQMFLRLVTLGEGVEDTRRRAQQAELLSLASHGAAMDDIIQTFAAYRLLTLDHDPSTRAPTVELAHEAILGEWKRLRLWLDESRADVRMGRLLAGSAVEWLDAKHDPGFLLSGSKLAQFEEWGATTGLALTADERAYLDASIAERERLAQLEQERQAHEAGLERRSRNFLRALVALFALAAILSGGLAFTANTQRTRAEAAEEDALRQASIGLAGQAQLELVEGIPERAVVLGLEALEYYPYTWQAERALFAAVQQNRIVHILDGHSAGVNTLAWSSDGKRLLTASDDGTARMWNMETGEALQVFEGHTEWVYKVRWSPDEQQVATTSADGTAIIWDADTGAALLTLSHGGRVNSVAWSPDRTRILTAARDNTAKVWDAQTGEELFTLSTHTDWVARADWSPDGARIATASLDGTTRIWDAVTFEELLVLPDSSGPEEMPGIWSPDGTRLATFNEEENRVTIWNANSGEAIFKLPGEGRGIIYIMAWSPDGSRLLSVEAGSNQVDGVAAIWDMTTGERIYRLPGQADMWLGDWSPDGTRVAVADEADVIRIWDAGTGEALFTLRYPGAPWDVKWSPDGNQLATAYQNGFVYIWDTTDTALLAFAEQDSSIGAWSPDGKRLLRHDRGGPLVVSAADSGETVMTIPVTDARWATWSPDGQYIGSSHSDGKGRIWDADSGEAQLVVEVNSESETLQGPFWSPASNQFLFADFRSGAIYVFDLATGEPLRTIETSSPGLCSAEWSPDGARIAANGERFVRIWDAASGEEQLAVEIGDLTCGVDWSPDGTRLVATDVFAGLVHILDAETGEFLLTFGGHVGAADTVEWSRNGTRIASAGDDATRIWDAVTGAEYGVLDVGDWQAHWSPDGTRLLTIGPEGVLRIWRVFPDTESLVAHARACCVFRDLTPEERQQFGLPER